MAILTTILLLMALMKRFIKEKVLSKLKAPQVNPQINAFLKSNSMNNVPLPNSNAQNFNVMSHNPEIVNTNNSLIFFLSGVPVVLLMFMLWSFGWSLQTSNEFGFSKDFIFVQLEIILYHLANFVNPLILYSQNKRLRKFVIEYYHDLLF